MEETHDRQLATILARGLIRALQRAKRAGMDCQQANDAPQPTAAELPSNVHQPTEPKADNEQEER